METKTSRDAERRRRSSWRPGDVAHGVVLGAASITLGLVGFELWSTLPAPALDCPASAATPPVICPDADADPDPDRSPGEVTPALQQRMTLWVEIEPDDAMVSVFVDGLPLTTGTDDERVVITGTTDTEIVVLANSPGHVPVRRRVPFVRSGLRVPLTLAAEASAPSEPAASEPTPKIESAPTRALAPTREAATATLRIGLERGVPPAQVWVDGEHLGPTPIVAHHVTSGTHEVQWRWSDGTSQTESVTVAGDDVAVLRAE